MTIEFYDASVKPSLNSCPRIGLLHVHRLLEGVSVYLFRVPHSVWLFFSFREIAIKYIGNKELSYEDQFFVHWSCLPTINPSIHPSKRNIYISFFSSTCYHKTTSGGSIFMANDHPLFIIVWESHLKWRSYWEELLASGYGLCCYFTVLNKRRSRYCKAECICCAIKWEVGEEEENMSQRKKRRMMMMIIREFY